MINHHSKNTAHATFGADGTAPVFPPPNNGAVPIIRAGTDADFFTTSCSSVCSEPEALILQGARVMDCGDLCRLLGGFFEGYPSDFADPEAIRHLGHILGRTADQMEREIDQ